MRRAYKALAFAAAAWVCVFATALAQSTVDGQVRSAQASIAAFNRTHDSDSLDAALRSLESAGGQRVRSNDRLTILNGYIAFFVALDRGMPRLSGKGPQVVVDPPRVKGVKYPPGISPSAIPDAAARARYERDIRANEALSEQFLNATILQRIDDRATILFGNFTRDKFKTANDVKLLRRSIQSSPLTSARKSKLLLASPTSS